MRARETHAGGSFLARERGAIDSDDRDEEQAQTKARNGAPLITFLSARSLEAVSIFTGKTIQELMEES